MTSLEPRRGGAGRRQPSPKAIAAGIAIAAVLAVAVWLVPGRFARATYDVVIDNAMVIDGTGASPFRGGVGIERGRIAAVWRGRGWTARARARRINARGLTLAPGFIDTHSHADLSVGDGGGPIRADNFVSQGVTTVIVGNCGRSHEDIARLRGIVERRGTNVNIATLVGMNTIRRRILGESAAPPNREQLLQMTAAARHAMAAGAIGISTGFEYVPGRFATSQEVVALLRVASRYGGVHTSHVRNEGHSVLPAVSDAIRMSSAARVPLLLSHVKITGRANCGKFAELERLIGTAPRPVYLDQYPYAASSTDLDIYLPDWFLGESARGRQAILRNDRHRLKAAIAAHVRKDGFRDLSFARVASFMPEPEWNGRTMRQIALRRNGSSSLDAQLEAMLYLVERGGAQMIYHNICPDVVERIQREMHPMIGTDSAIRSDGGRGLPHPRGWGAFPKFLGYAVRERRVASLSEAVRRMTDVPARFFGIRNRGRIAPGYVADLVIFDARTVAGPASYLRPLLRPTGIPYVLVAGEFVVDQRSAITSSRTDVTDAAPGRFIARNPALRREGDGLVASTLVNDPPAPLAVRTRKLASRPRP
jgi:N-acyl-D-amino-acid deacylase